MSEKNTLIETVPAAGELRKVDGFNPLKFLRQTTSRNGEKVLKLELPYKKLWFRMACPNGRMLLNRLRITDQMAIIEAKVYADKDDPVPLASFTSMQEARNVPGGMYLRVAQDEALNEALDNAGFGIQLCDVAQVSDGSGYGSEVPLSKVGEAAHTPPPAPVREQEVKTPKEEPVPVTAIIPISDTEPHQAAAEAQPLTAFPEAAAEAEPTHTELAQPQEDDPVPQEPATTASLQEEDAKEAPFTAGTADAEPPQETEPAAAQCSYTADMPVEEICQRMTLEEARQLEVPLGTCKGWTLGQVETGRPASLRWLILDHNKVGNPVKAGARLILDEITQKKAG